MIERGFSDAERSLLTTLESLAGEVVRLELCSPAVVIIGEVVAVAPQFAATVGVSYGLAVADLPAAAPGLLMSSTVPGRPDRPRSCAASGSASPPIAGSADLITALERRGARVMHAPALMIAPNDQDGSLIIETRELIMARPEVVLVTTGYGMRRWLEVADAAGLGAELTAALENARIFARGPKAHGAVRAAGLLDAAADHPRHHGVPGGCRDRRRSHRPPGGDPAPRLHRRGPARPAPGGERERAERHAVPAGSIPPPRTGCPS